MYKIQECCDNCAHCLFVSYLSICSNKDAEMFEKNVDASGYCEQYKKGAFKEEKENDIPR